MKAKTLFDHIKDLFTKKQTWEDLSETDKKSFSVFMVNRFLSMDSDYAGIINYVQSFSTVLSPEMTYKLYVDILPKQNGFFKKYIKSKKHKSYSDELIKLLCNHLQCSSSEIEEYLIMLPTLDSLEPTLKLYGLGSKEINKMLKVNEE